MSTPIIQVEGLSKVFGGVHAIENLSFSIQQGHIHSVIGPNGAGKTTLFNLITGIYTPTHGDIKLKGESIVGLDPSQLAPRGMCRTFQNLQICMNMTALENVMIGQHLQFKSSLLATLFRLPCVVQADQQAREKAAELMDFVGCAKYLNTEASAMPYGALKRLEIARALAAKPDILLLDEPAAGLNGAETAELDTLIQKVAQSGVTVVLVEHDMKLVMNISDYLLVLDYGKKLAEGTPEEIRHNPDVIAAYLGG
ncbi:branched-chain amino acid transport system ATP-binding protein [Allopseudospirillum japonicum]|uniref:Branched-chain amino acid transport system ATP-binding protein n=1 Tax=Allopseudospirillum japonicum TaxID=64971 RepID=A0A1H6T4X0_9GAMM|nr:ABC transporter ATP-binding protein [Allopseudospirillum japonicum]SEI70822.1 branched-chain amino acid transport system ATP-binding protein [Allopseudospirillum japonicum]